MRFSFTPKDIGRMIRQRLYWFVIPFAVCAIVGLVVVSRLPELYESRALLLVEEQQVPDIIVQTTISSDSMERLERVRAEIMARDNLVRIGDQANVFGGARLTRTQKHGIMLSRARISVDHTIGQRGGGGRKVSVITATISFKDENPRKAQEVANLLTSQFESTNISLRREQAGRTADFILQEEKKVRDEIAAVSDQIARIKAENPNALPANRSFYESTVQRLLIDRTRTQAEISSTQTSLQQLQMQESLYTSSEMTPREQRLADLRTELSTLRQQYRDAYPEVRAVKRQVLDLERQVDPQAFRENARTEIADLEAQRDETRPGTPAYDEADERIAELTEQLETLPRTGGSSSPGQVSYNGQVFALQSRLDTLARQEENLDRQIADMEKRIAEVPQVESQLYSLVEEQSRLERDLAGVQAKRATAERSESVEAQARGERTVTLEQPVAPDSPTSPNKPKLALAVFAFAGGIAGLFVLVPEVLFAKVQSREHLTAVMPDIPVIEVPRFKTADERLPKLLTTASLATASLVLGIALSWTAFQTLT